MLTSAWVMMSMSRPWMPMETAGLPSMGLTVSNTENFTPWFMSSRLSFWMSSRLSATAPGKTMASRYWSGFWARRVSAETMPFSPWPSIAFAAPCVRARANLAGMRSFLLPAARARRA